MPTADQLSIVELENQVLSENLNFQSALDKGSCFDKLKEIRVRIREIESKIITLQNG